MMDFPSKKDWWLYPIITGIVVVCFLPAVVEQDYVALFFTVPLTVLVLWCWFTTGYRISGELLIIRAGPFKKRIPIDKIQKIRPTKNPLSAPALSLDRLEVTYQSGYGYALISPADRERFIAMLIEKNPKIKVEKSG